MLKFSADETNLNILEFVPAHKSTFFIVDYFFISFSVYYIFGIYFTPLSYFRSDGSTKNEAYFVFLNCFSYHITVVYILIAMFKYRNRYINYILDQKKDQI